jgi:signal peptidase I
MGFQKGRKDMSQTPAAAPKKDAKKEIMEWVKSILIALIIVAIVRTFLFTMIRVDGTSMLETLQDGDRLAATIIDGKLFGYNRGDVVICTYPGADHYCVKRVIGLPGEEISIKEGTVYINGEALDEPYLTHKSTDSMDKYQIPEGAYFVMGDNRPVSLDSRAVGPVEAGPWVQIGVPEKGAILAKVHLRLWPFDTISTID